MPLHSRTSQYGQLHNLLNLPAAVDTALQSHFERTLHERILSGEFAREWSEAQAHESDRVAALYRRAKRLPMAMAESRLRRAQD